MREQSREPFILIKSDQTDIIFPFSQLTEEEKSIIESIDDIIGNRAVNFKSAKDSLLKKIETYAQAVKQKLKELRNENDYKKILTHLLLISRKVEDLFSLVYVKNDLAQEGYPLLKVNYQLLRQVRDLMIDLEVQPTKDQETNSVISAIDKLFIQLTIKRGQIELLKVAFQSEGEPISLEKFRLGACQAKCVNSHNQVSLSAMT